MKSLNAKFVSNKLKKLITFYSIHAFVWVHVELFIWNVLLSGFILKLKNKSLVGLNITTLRSLNVKFAKHNSP